MGACQQEARGLAAEHPLHGIRRPGGSHVTFVHARPALRDPRERPARPMSLPQVGSPNCQNAASQRMPDTGVSTCLARTSPTGKAVSAKHDWRFGGNPVATLVQASRSRSKPRSSNAPACCSVGPGAGRNRLPGRPGREAWFNVSEARPASGGVKLRTGSLPVARLVPALLSLSPRPMRAPLAGPAAPGHRPVRRPRAGSAPGSQIGKPAIAHRAGGTGAQPRNRRRDSGTGCRMQCRSARKSSTAATTWRRLP